MSEKQEAYQHSPENLKRLRRYTWSKGHTPHNLGIPHSPEIRAKIKRAWYPHGATLPGRPKSPEMRRKLGDTRRGKSLEEIMGPVTAARMKAIWSEIGKRRKGQPRPDLALRNKDPNFTLLRLRNSRRKPNKSELRLIKVIEEHHLPFLYTGHRATFGTLKPDFTHSTDKKVIEIFGTWFHSKAINTKVPWEATEAGRRARLAEYGYKALIFWDPELRKLSDEAIAERIRAFSQEPVNF